MKQRVLDQTDFEFFMLNRIADAYFWLGRYLERAAQQASWGKAHFETMLDGFPGRVLLKDLLDEAQSLWMLMDAEERAGFQVHRGTLDAEAIQFWQIFDIRNPNAIRSCITTARYNAQGVRESLSGCSWECMNQLYLDITHPQAEQHFLSFPDAFFRRVITGIDLFQGIGEASLLHQEEWELLQCGKWIERATQVSQLLKGYVQGGIELGRRLQQQGMKGMSEENEERDKRYEVKMDCYLSKRLLCSCRAQEGDVYRARARPSLKDSPFRQPLMLSLNPNLALENALWFLMTAQRFPQSLHFCVQQLGGWIQRIRENQTFASWNTVCKQWEILCSSLYSNDTVLARVQSMVHKEIESFLEGIQEELMKLADTVMSAYGVSETQGQDQQEGHSAGPLET